MSRPPFFVASAASANRLVDVHLVYAHRLTATCHSERVPSENGPGHIGRRKCDRAGWVAASSSMLAAPIG